MNAGSGGNFLCALTPRAVRVPPNVAHQVLEVNGLLQERRLRLWLLLSTGRLD
jgi:hypothetical protein